MYVRYEESCIPGCVRVPRASSLKSRSAELAQIISRPDPEIFSSLMIRVANSPPSILGSHGIVAFCLQIRASECHQFLPQIRGDPLATTEWRSARRDPSTGRHASAFRRLASLAGSADVQHRVLAASPSPTPPTSASTEIMSRGEPRSNRPAHMQSPHIVCPHFPGALAFLPSRPGTAVHPRLPDHRAHGSVVEAF